MAEVSQRVLKFGQFRFIPARGELHENGRPIQVGRRALDLLLALIERRDEVVTKRALLEAAWPDLFIDDANLRVQIGLLRRALGEHAQSYILNVPGRGYSFVGRVEDTEAELATAPKPSSGTTLFPNPLTRLVGREEIVASLVPKLGKQRVVTIVGTGGIGKTSVAIATAHAFSRAHGSELCFVDLTGVTEPARVPTAVAAALSLPVHAPDVTNSLCHALEERRLLIVLDNCEHLIEAAATLVEILVGRTRAITVLATSREPLRIQGELVSRLLPLPVPEGTMTASEALTYAAVQLFIDRATTGSDDFRFSDEDVPTVIEICRKLDGIPLALEMAAARAGTLGIKTLACGLDQRFLLLTRGLRTALPRHQTLRAALEWSHELLSLDEQTLLRRLALFQGDFTLEDAYAVADFDHSPLPYFQDLVAELVSKSMVSIHLQGDMVVYRLLEAMRAFGLEKLRAAAEDGTGSRRHAEHFIRCLDHSSADWDVAPASDASALYKRALDDVRRALDWAFSPDGDASIGTALTAASAPLWLQLTLFVEYRGWLELVFERFSAGLEQKPEQEMRLRAALGMVIFNMDGPAPGALSNNLRCLALAEALRSASFQLRSLCALAGLANLSSQFRRSLHYAEQYGRVAATASDNERARFIYNRIMALGLHQLGDQPRARRHVDLALEAVPPTREQRRVTYQYDHWVAARSTLARIVWLQGQPDLALRLAEAVIDEAFTIDHKPSSCHALAFSACPVALWSGDLPSARRYMAQLKAIADRYGFAFWQAWVTLYETLLPSLETAAPAEDRTPVPQEPRPLIYAGLLATLDVSRLCPTVLDAIATDEDAWFTPEALRAAAEQALAVEGEAAFDRAEALLRRSAALAARQGALSWELRTATSLARLLALRRRPDEAAAQLRTVYGRFTEGFGTPDLIAAARLLESL